MTYLVRKGSAIVGAGLVAAAVGQHVDAARLSGARGDIQIVRESDGALVLHTDAGELVDEATWRAGFRARFGSTGLAIRPAAPAPAPPTPRPPAPPVAVPARPTPSTFRSLRVGAVGRGSSGYQARRERAAEIERVVKAAEGGCPWRDSKPFDASKTRRTG